MWCAVANLGVLGPYFFWEGRQNGFSYFISLCADAAKLSIAKVQGSLGKCKGVVSIRWSNRPYCKKTHGCFARTLCSTFNFFALPARLPDLLPCDYFLWGYVKAEG